MNQNIKPNYAELARQYKADYRTVKSAFEKISQSVQPKKKEETTRKSKLDPYKSIIDEKLIMGCSAKSIFKFIEKKGFKGKYTTVREYCKQHKEDEIKKATIHVTHQPALSAQVDWKEEMKLISSEGEVVQFSLFLYVIGH